METLQTYLLPYLISQAVALGILIAAFNSTRLARLLFAFVFIPASVFNMYTGLTAPEVYQDYASMAVPFYRDFITGWFSGYAQLLIPAIAVGQFLIGMGMLLKGWWVKWACIGAVVFLLSIAPLLVGSAFPFSLIVSWAALLILRRDQMLSIGQGINRPHRPGIRSGMAT